MPQQNEYQCVCDNIRYLRRSAGLSRTGMARRLHITVKTLDLLESGVFPQRINIRFFFYVHQVFGIAPRKMLTACLSEESSGKQ